MQYGNGWMWDEGSWWYAAPIGALSVNDNCIDFHVKPGKLGKPAIIDHFPKTEYISQLNKTTTVESNVELKKLKIERDWVGRTNHFLMTGEIAISDSSDTLQRNIHDPTLFTGTLFKESLGKYGVQVDQIKIGTKNDELEPIAIHNSNPLLLSATNLMNESDNLTAEIFIKVIAIVLILAVAIVLVLGIGTLFKGGSTSKKYSNKLMQLRVLLQFIAIIVLVCLAYFFKD